jgi:hypothetical protein
MLGGFYWRGEAARKFLLSINVLSVHACQKLFIVFGATHSF